MKLKSILEPFEVALLKMINDALKPYGIKPSFNFFEDGIKGFNESKIQELGNRAFTDKNSILVLYYKTSPLSIDSTFGETGKTPYLKIIDFENDKIIKKDFFNMTWTYQFKFIARSREVEELLEFLFYKDIRQSIKNLQFVMRIDGKYDLPLTYNLSWDMADDASQLDEDFIYNLWYFGSNLTVRGPVFSPYSIELEEKPIRSINFELLMANSPNTEEDLNTGNYTIISEITDDGNVVTFDDLQRDVSQSDDLIQIEKETE